MSDNVCYVDAYARSIEARVLSVDPADPSLVILGDPMGQSRSWILLLAAFDAIYWSLCGMMFGRVVDE